MPAKRTGYSLNVLLRFEISIQAVLSIILSSSLPLWSKCCMLPVRAQSILISWLVKFTCNYTALHHPQWTPAWRFWTAQSRTLSFGVVLEGWENIVHVVLFFANMIQFFSNQLLIYIGGETFFYFERRKPPYIYALLLTLQLDWNYLKI